MSDLISRQAAIDALARTARENFNLSDEFNHYLAGLMDGENAIRQLPSTQTEQRWIPVSERLPEGGHNIIFCDTKGNVCEGMYHAILGQWVGFRRDAIYHHDDVVAWMPLPEPMELEED